MAVEQERYHTPEQAEVSAGVRQQEILSHLETRGIRIEAAAWQKLLPEVRLTRNLRAEIGNAEYLPNELLAYVTRDGRVLIDQEKFSLLTEREQCHLLYHEAAHRLDWQLSQRNLEEMAELSELVGQIPPEQHSAYVQHLAEKYRDHPNIDNIIRAEAGAEMIAQYLESDGSFRGYLEAKIPRDPATGEPAYRSVEATEEFMSRLEGFDDWSEDEQLAFFEERPDLAVHFHAYFNLNSIFSQPELLNDITQDWGQDYEVDFFDEEVLVKPPLPLAPAPKNSLPAKPASGFDPFWIFRS